MGSAWHRVCPWAASSTAVCLWPSPCKQQAARRALNWLCMQTASCSWELMVWRRAEIPSKCKPPGLLSAPQRKPDPSRLCKIHFPPAREGTPCLQALPTAFCITCALCLRMPGFLCESCYLQACTPASIAEEKGASPRGPVRPRSGWDTPPHCFYAVQCFTKCAG